MVDATRYPIETFPKSIRTNGTNGGDANSTFSDECSCCSALMVQTCGMTHKWDEPLCCACFEIYQKIETINHSIIDISFGVS